MNVEGRDCRARADGLAIKSAELVAAQATKSKYEASREVGSKITVILSKLAKWAAP